MRYKKLLANFGLIIDKRLGQGRPNRIYILKPESRDTLKSQKGTSRSPKTAPQEVPNRDTNDTDFIGIDLNNVNEIEEGSVVDNSRDEIIERNKEKINDIRKKIRKSLNRKCGDNLSEMKCNEKDREFLEKENNSGENHSRDSKVFNHNEFNRRSEEKELLANEIADVLEDDHSLGAFRTIVDKISEQQIRIFLSTVKDTHLTGKIKNNRGAMFISLAKAYAGKNNINLNFK